MNSKSPKSKDKIRQTTDQEVTGDELNKELLGRLQIF